MIRALFISILLLSSLDARENPFFPSVGEKDIPVTTNEESSQTPLKRAAIVLPTQARVLQKVTIEFKNLDGSVENKSIELDNTVDWHLPLFISQSYVETSNGVKPEQASSPVSQKKSLPKETAKDESKIILFTSFLKISSSAKILKMATSDEAIRNFLVVNPHRIVVDFKKDTDIKSYVKKSEGDIFKEVRIGNHDGYYRVVVELDGHYRYNFKKVADGYLVELK